MTSWIKTIERMPEPGRAVFVVCVGDYGARPRFINRAMWVPAKHAQSSEESDIGEYDEDTDTYYDPEGWYELVSHWDEYSALGMSSVTVTHWMDLPELPKD